MMQKRKSLTSQPFREATKMNSDMWGHIKLRVGFNERLAFDAPETLAAQSCPPHQQHRDAMSRWYFFQKKR